MEEHRFDRIIDEELKNPSGFSLPVDFAEKTSRKIERRQTMHENVKEFFIILGSIAFLAGLTLLFAFLLDMRLNTNLITRVFSYGNLFPGIASFFIFSIFMDKIGLPFLWILRKSGAMRF